jgi:hypothetical protein
MYNETQKHLINQSIHWVSMYIICLNRSYATKLEKTRVYRINSPQIALETKSPELGSLRRKRRLFESLKYVMNPQTSDASSPLSTSLSNAFISLKTVWESYVSEVAGAHRQNWWRHGEIRSRLTGCIAYLHYYSRKLCNETPFQPVPRWAEFVTPCAYNGVPDKFALFLRAIFIEVKIPHCFKYTSD